MFSMRTGLKTYFAVIGIFLAILGVIVFLVHSGINSIISDLIQQEAIAANRSFSNSLEDLQGRATERAQMISGSEYFIGNLEHRDLESLQSTVNSFAEGIDFAIVTDPDGLVLARTNSNKYGDRLSGCGAFSAAVNTGVTASALEPFENISLAYCVSAPVFIDGRIIGAVNCFVDLTSSELVDDFKLKNRCDAAIFYGTERVSTTLTDESGGRKTGTTIDERVIETVFIDHSMYTGRLKIFGQTYETCVSPLTDGDETVGMISTVINIDAVLARQRTINYWIILIACVGVSAALIVSTEMRKFSQSYSQTLGKLSSKEESHNILTKILSGMEAALYVSDLETDEIIFINDKAREYFDLGDETIGRPCWQVFKSGTQGRCKSCAKEKLALCPDTPVVWNDFNTAANRHFVHNDSVIDWPGGKKVHLSELYDISDLKQLQVDLMRISSIIHSSPNFISYKSADDKCLYVNPAASAITGFSQEELLEDYLGLIFDGETAERLRTQVPLALRESGKTTYEATGKTKCGKELSLLFTSFIVDYEDQAFGTIAANITEIKQIEAQKAEAMERAERASRAKSEFLSRMSHEMKTPMNAIIGMTSIAKKLKDTRRLDDCLNKVDSAAHHLLSIISDILDMTNMEHGGFELHNSEFNFRKMVSETLAMFKFDSEENKRSFYVNMDRDIPPSIISDERRLGQVIANLLSNAIKFSPEDGRIVLNAFVTEKTESHCTILTEVIDNGIGIPKESHGLLFDAFEQLDGSISRKYGGSGLGLAICKHILDLMGGSIWVESEPGKGSKFSFSITVEMGAPGCVQSMIMVGGSTPSKHPQV